MSVCVMTLGPTVMVRKNVTRQKLHTHTHTFMRINVLTREKITVYQMCRIASNAFQMNSVMYKVNPLITNNLIVNLKLLFKNYARILSLLKFCFVILHQFGMTFQNLCFDLFKIWMLAVYSHHLTDFPWFERVQLTIWYWNGWADKKKKHLQFFTTLEMVLVHFSDTHNHWRCATCSAYFS